MDKLYFNARRSRVNKTLLFHAEAVLREWLPGGENRGGEFVALNPLREDSNTGSFSIHLISGVWKDFAVDEFGGPDLVSLYMALNDLDESDALAALERYLAKAGLKHRVNIQAKSRPTKKAELKAAPAPIDCHLPPDIHPDLGEPSAIWEYKTADGQTAFYVYRFETEKGKETRPVSYNPETKDWQWKAPTPPRPIYNLDKLAGDSLSPVVVPEGEKAADAAADHFPDFISTTSASGSSNALKSDWKPLYGREVTLIPDADEPGRKYVQTIGAELVVNGSEVFIVDTLEMGWKDGDDVADYADLDQDWLQENRQPIREWRGFRDMDDRIVEAAARLSPLDYDRHKDELVELLGGVSKRTLDGLVKQARRINAENEEEDVSPNSVFSDEQPWPEPVEGKGLVQEIQTVIRSHVILSDREALAVALWILTSYVFRQFRICPRLLISSPEKRCGKTTLLETIQALCFRGLAAANISSASLYRGLEAWSPTLLIDEADTFLAGNDELRGILNSGHTKSTAYVIRTVGDDHEPKLFPTFAPIALGMIKTPPDTLLDRSVVIRLQRKLGTDPVAPLPLEAEQAYLPIRQKCVRWAQDHADQLENNRELTPSDIGNDRARDNWIPLTAIAQQCGLLEEAQAACQKLTQKDDDSLTVELLSDIQQIFWEANKDKLPSKILVKKLIDMEERPWTEYCRGKPLTQNKLAQLLKGFSIHTVQARVGAKNLKHYQLSNLQPIFDRYLKKDTASHPTDGTATPLQDGARPHQQRDCAVAVEVAVANEVPSLLDTLTAKDTISERVADVEPLPLQPELPKTQAGQGLQPRSGVADQNQGGQDSPSNQGETRQ